MKKYEFTGETKQVATKDGCVILHRIRAIRSFGEVNAGDLGGWIEKERNLSHKKTAWVMEDAEVRDNAMVQDNACIRGSAKIRGNAKIRGHAKIADKAIIRGHAKIDDYVEISGNVIIEGNARIHCYVMIWGRVEISGNAMIGEIDSYIEISGYASIAGNAKITSTNHVLVIGPIGSRDDYTTFYRNKNDDISVVCGCFSGDIETFLEQVAEYHRCSKHAQVYQLAAELAKAQINFYSGVPEKGDADEIRN